MQFELLVLYNMILCVILSLLACCFCPNHCESQQKARQFQGLPKHMRRQKSNSQLLTPPFLEKMTMHMENCMYWMSLHYLHTYTHTQRLCHGSSTWGGRLEEFVVVREHLSKGLQLLFMRRLHLQQGRQGVPQHITGVCVTT